MSGELVGPLPVIRFADGTPQPCTVPANTMDIRYAVCRDHHPACDCREALLAEDAGEYRAMFRQLESAILAAIKGHQTYVCVIARAASKRAAAAARERDRAHYARLYPDMDEVPFR